MQKKGFFGFLAGCTAGAAAMYFADPHRGAYRRAFLRDKGIHYRKLIGRKAYQSGKDILYRSKGVVARARSRFAPQRVSDDVLLARVCSKIGRILWNPHRLEIKVNEGEISVFGKVLPREVDLLVDTIRKTPGVRSVKNRLEILKPASA